MFSFLKKADNNSSNFPWKNVESEELLDQIMNSDKTVAIFKHSTRCIISKTVKSRFEQMAENASIDLYIISVIDERPFSNYIAEKSGVIHQSPQFLVFKDGSCIYNESHDSILHDDTLAYLQK